MEGDPSQLWWEGILHNLVPGSGEVRGQVGSMTKQPKQPTPRQRAWARLVSEMGRKGGKASAKALTPEQRKERARKAGVARWSRRAPKEAEEE